MAPSRGVLVPGVLLLLMAACSDAGDAGALRASNRRGSAKGDAGALEPDGDPEEGGGAAGGATRGGSGAGGAGPGGSGPGSADAGTISDGGFLRGPNVLVTPVAGVNTVDLGDAAPAARGAKLSFEAILTPGGGASKGTLVVSKAAIDNGASGGVRLVRPVWIVEDAQERSLAFASQNDVDLSVPAGRKSPYAKLSFVVDAWAAGAKLRITFGALAATTATAITGLPTDMYVECKSASAFSPGVSRHWGTQGCRNCHSGLFAYDFFGKDEATSCGLNRKLLRAGGPNLLRPTQAGHAGGGMADGAAYQQAIGAWRTAEQ